ncbi:MAG: hypothetical protein IJN60_06130 [Oscillospiraceae bacterium]|nr:hypothetical protein [Oscillospiraceae bacterium]
MAADRFLAACLIGMQLGFVYDFLRPLRPKLTTIPDLLFLTALGAGWVYLAFGICRGDLRFGYTVGLGVGIFFWELTATRILRRFFGYFWLSIRKIYRFFRKIAKKLFATGRKKVTISCNLQKRRQRYEEADAIASPGTGTVRPKQPAHQDRSGRDGGGVYGGASDAERNHPHAEQAGRRSKAARRAVGVRAEPTGRKTGKSGFLGRRGGCRQG